MSSERFPSDNPTDSPSEHTPDAPDNFEQPVDQSDTSGSFIHDGGVQLAENLSKIAGEQGPDGIQGYLTDLLADTEGNVPTAERAAAFTLLAERQKQFTREKIVHAGIELNTRLGAQTKNAKVEIQTNGTAVSRAVSNFSDIRRLIDRNVRVPANAEEASHVVRHARDRLTSLDTERARWASLQTASIQEFHGALDYGKRSESRLREGGLTVSEDYDGDPVDLSKLIDPAVAASFARELHQEFASEGSNAAKIVMDKLATDEDTATLESIHLLDSFAKDYSKKVQSIGSARQLSQVRLIDASDRYLRDYRNQHYHAFLGGNRGTEEGLLNIANQAGRTTYSAISSTEDLQRRLTANLSAVQRNRHAGPKNPETTAFVAETTPEVTPTPSPDYVKTEEIVITTPDSEPPAAEVVPDPVEALHEEASSEATSPETEDDVENIVQEAKQHAESAELPQPDYASAKGMKETVRGTTDTFRPVSHPKPEFIGVTPPQETRRSETVTPKSTDAQSEAEHRVPPKSQQAKEPKIAESIYKEGFVYPGRPQAPHQEQPKVQPAQERRYTAPSARSQEGTTQFIPADGPKIYRGNAAPRQRPADPNAFAQPLFQATKNTDNWVTKNDRVIAEAQARGDKKLQRRLMNAVRKRFKRSR